jgi:hypothetical protein
MAFTRPRRRPWATSPSCSPALSVGARAQRLLLLLCCCGRLTRARALAADAMRKTQQQLALFADILYALQLSTSQDPLRDLEPLTRKRSQLAGPRRGSAPLTWVMWCRRPRAAEVAARHFSWDSFGSGPSVRYQPRPT